MSDHDEADAGRRLMLRRIVAGAASLVLAAFAVIVWYVYDEGVKRGASLAPPLIKAPEGPTKVKPAEPGGLRVPDQDKRVYETMEKTLKTEESEFLLPPSEAPKPEPALPTPGQTATVDGNDGPKMPAVPVQSISEKPLPPARPGSAGVTDTVDTRPAAGSTATIRQVDTDETAQETTDRSKTAALDTGQNTQPVAPATATARAPGDFAVQLGSYRSRDAAEQGWAAISGDNPNQLQGLGHRVLSVDLGEGKGTFYRLQAVSPAFVNRVAPQMICDQLKSRKQGCMVVKQ